MLAAVTDLIVLAQEGAEGVPADTLAAKLALPVGLLLFLGSVYVLLWAVYGAKKGALEAAVGFFGFTFVLGLFWWFGAPGTPQATGLQNFPNQRTESGRSDIARYQAKWHPFEPGSEMASFFPAADGTLDAFGTLVQYIGAEDATPEQLQSSPKYRVLFGDLDTASRLMTEQFMPVDENGSLRIGGNRRAAWNEAAGDPQPGEEAADPFFTSRVRDRDGDGNPDVLITTDNGLEVAAAELEAVATWVTFTEAGREDREIVVETRPWYAFKDPGAVWFPSAVWTVLSALFFGGAVFGLDRIEQKEKAAAGEAAATRERELVQAGR